MSKNELDMPLGDLISKVDFESLFAEKCGRRQVNFWINPRYGAKFLDIQKRTHYRFGREIVKLIEKCIDLAESADPEKNDPKSA